MSTSLGPLPVRVRASPALVVLAAATVAAAIGLSATDDLRYGLAAIGGAALLTVAFVRLPVAVGLWIVALYLAGVPGTAGAPTGTSLLLLAGWTVTVLGRATSRAPTTPWLRARWPIVAAGALLLWAGASVLWATDRSVALDTTQRLGIAVAALPVVVLACARMTDVLEVAAAFVAGATAAVLVGVLSGTGAAPADPIAAAEMAAGRLHVGITDPNYLAADIVAALAITSGLLAVRGLRAWRPWLLGCVPVLAYGLVATQSRGGMLAALAAAVLVAALAERRHRRRIVAVVGLVVLLLGAFLAAQPRAVERLTQDDRTGTGRTDVWRVAWATTADNMPLGVGAGNFQVVERRYAQDAGFLSRPGMIVDEPLVAHDVWLQAVVELGVPGLALLAVALAACIGSSFAAGRRFARSGRRDLAAACRAIGAGQLAVVVAATFVSNADDRLLWVLLALGPALLVHAPARPRL